MDKRYWIGRKRPAMSSRGATPAEARLILDGPEGGPGPAVMHDFPFMLSVKGPATPGERIALDLTLPALPRPRPTYRGRRGPAGSARDGQ
jgi:hypothetical protein